MNKYRVKQNVKVLGGVVLMLMVMMGLGYSLFGWEWMRWGYVFLFVVGIICYLVDRKL